MQACEFCVKYANKCLLDAQRHEKDAARIDPTKNINIKRNGGITKEEHLRRAVDCKDESKKVLDKAKKKAADGIKCWKHQRALTIS